MASIRNLSGAPSALDLGGGNRRRARSQTYNDGDIASSLSSRTFSHLGVGGAADGGPGRPLRRSLNHPFGSSQHHAAGELASSSTFQPHPTFSSWRPRYHVASAYNLSDASDRSSMMMSGAAPPPPPTTTPSPPSGRFRKLRSSTWDSGGMALGRLSPKLPFNKSHSYDHSPSSTGSGQGLPTQLEEEEEGSKALPGKVFFEDSEADLNASESDAESEEAKVEEAEEEGPTTLDEAIHRLSDLTPRSDAGSDREGGDSTNSIFRDTNHSSAKSSDSRSVTFAEDIADVAEYNEEEDKRRNSIDKRPGYCAKLPSLTKWEKIDEGEEQSVASSIGSPIANARSKVPIDPRFQRQHSQATAPGLLAKLNPFGNLSWSLIGSCIVRTAPCFWCSKKLGISATDREILLRLNLLVAFFCVVQICIGIFLFVIKVTGFVEDDTNELASQSSQQDTDKPLVSADLWDLELFVYCLSVINLVLLIACMFAQRAIREVNLVGSVRFMWCIFWLLPVQIFFMIGLFDYYYVQDVKVEHWWDDPSMKRAREVFCECCANDQCKVPVLGGVDYDTEEEWCIAKYNETNCKEIRDDAQEKYRVTARTFYTSNGIWALVLVVIMWTTLCVLQAIITLPIVQRSKESNIPLWLTFPIVGCFTVGYLLHYSQTSVTEDLQDVYWIALAYFISGGAFALAALIGIFLKCYTVLNGRQRKIKQGVVIVFLATIILTVFSVGTIFVTSLIYSLNIVGLPLDQYQYQTIACSLDMSGSCTGCDQEDPLLMCPEWSDEDVKKVLQTVFKQSATLAAIFLVYALITLRYGFVLFRYVSRYQIEYV